MISKEWILKIGRQILLARRKVHVCVNFSPESIRNRVFRSLPAMELACNIATDFNPHPASTVVINAVSCLVGITCRVGVAYLSLIHISEPTRLGMISYAV